MSRRHRFAGMPATHYLDALRDHEQAARDRLDLDVDEETRSELVFRQRMIQGAALRACVAMLREVLAW